MSDSGRSPHLRSADGASTSGASKASATVDAALQGSTRWLSLVPKMRELNMLSSRASQKKNELDELQLIKQEVKQKLKEEKAGKEAELKDRRVMEVRSSLVSRATTFA